MTVKATQFPLQLNYRYSLGKLLDHFSIPRVTPNPSRHMRALLKLLSHHGLLRRESSQS